MAQLTKAEITRIVGPVDDSIVLDIVKTGADARELLEAFTWLSEDDIMADTLHREPHGVVAELLDILKTGEIPTEPEI